MKSVRCRQRQTLVAAVAASPAELVGSYGGVVGAARASVGDSLLGCFGGQCSMMSSSSCLSSKSPRTYSPNFESNSSSKSDGDTVFSDSSLLMNLITLVFALTSATFSGCLMLLTTCLVISSFFFMFHAGQWGVANTSKATML